MWHALRVCVCVCVFPPLAVYDISDVRNFSLGVLVFVFSMYVLCGMGVLPLCFVVRNNHTLSSCLLFICATCAATEAYPIFYCIIIVMIFPVFS